MRETQSTLPSSSPTPPPAALPPAPHYAPPQSLHRRRCPRDLTSSSPPSFSTEALLLLEVHQRCHPDLPLRRLLPLCLTFTIRPISAAVTTTASQSDHAASGDATRAARPGGKTRNREGKVGSSSKGSSPPLPTVSPVAGKGFQLAETATSGDLGLNGRQGCTEGVGGLMDLLPSSPNSLLPGNGGCLNSARIGVEGAPHLFDGMPERNLSANPGYNFRLEAGEVWEKGPETITRDRDTIQAIFTSPSQGPSLGSAGAGRSGQPLPTNINAEKTQPPGVLQMDPIDRDAQMEGPRGGGHAPVRAGEAGGHHALSSPTTVPDRPAEFQQLSRSTILTSGGLAGPIEASGQANTSVYAVGGAGSKGGRGSSYSDGMNVAHFLTDCTQTEPICHDFQQLEHPSDFSPNKHRPWGKEGMEEGQMGCGLGVVRGPTLQDHTMPHPARRLPLSDLLLLRRRVCLTRRREIPKYLLGDGLQT